ncbi:MAG: hypothetical protein AB4372_06410 [Xenococcus sp. (in: cyanobacteria)]
MNKPSCGAAFVQNSGIRSKMLLTNTTATNNIVRFRRVDQITNSILQTANLYVISNTLPLIGVDTSSPGGIQSLAIDDTTLDLLRDKARQNYCKDVGFDDIHDVCFIELLIISMTGMVEITVHQNNFTIVRETGNPLITNPWIPPPNNPLYPSTLSGFHEIKLNDEKNKILGYIYKELEWEEIDGNVREMLVDSYITDDEIVQITKNNVEFLDSPLPFVEDESVEVQANNYTDGSTVITNGEWYPLPEPPRAEPDTDNDNDTGSGNPQQDPDVSDPNNNTDTDIDTSQNPDDTQEESLSIPDLETVEATEFSAPNFVQYAVTVFSNKFPFDIVGDLDIGQISSDCPTYTFFDTVFELCPIRDVIVVLKFPVIIGFLIKTYHSL